MHPYVRFQPTVAPLSTPGGYSPVTCLHDARKMEPRNTLNTPRAAVPTGPAAGVFDGQPDASIDLHQVSAFLAERNVARDIRQHRLPAMLKVESRRTGSHSFRGWCGNIRD